MIAILVPVLGRPQNAAPLVESIAANTTVAHHVLFLCSPNDRAEIDACVASGAEVEVVDWMPGDGDWARKINHGVELAVTLWDDTEFFLLGADDLRFHPEWDMQALKVAKHSRAGVVGTNDLGNATVMRGDHSTHPLVRRTYADLGTIDDPTKLLHEGYHHQWVDTELVATAKARGQWAFAKHSCVEHLHPFWRKSKLDPTYRKALSTPHQDRAIFLERKALWERKEATV